MKNLQDAKKKYEEVEIPMELNNIVKNSIKEAKRKQKRRKPVKQWGIGLAAAAALFITSVNVSPALAQSLSSVPMLGSIVQVVTVQEIKIAEDNFNADISTPNVTGLENKELEQMLNDKYIAENEALYDNFQKKMEEMKAAGGGNYAVNADYEVLTDTDSLLVIQNRNLEIMASGSESATYDNIDKEHELYITLPSLFKDDSYVQVISAYIKEEMKKQMANEEVVYFLEEDGDGFASILPDQQFYITADNKLIISFDEYEVAPGYMGMVTFEIPTEVIRDILISDYYIK
ncbi:RsiV family protein [Psychrobacillus sp. NPDC093180]|uniref:RsiV family protein n=1 Tax=Psychrobacillus sp. NPDC093180 TaxID=3364489 RepID=UPI0037F53E57